MPPFTRENAAILGRKGAIARWLPKPAPPPVPPEPQGDAYTRQRLAIVREHIARIDKLMLNTADGQRLNWFAQAQDKLAEQERILSGRPLPGSRRPKEERVVSAHPMDSGQEPVPVAVESPKESLLPEGTVGSPPPPDPQDDGAPSLYTTP